MKKKKEQLISLEVFKQSGRKGGFTTAKRGRKFYEQIGSKGGHARWKNQSNKLGIQKTKKSIQNSDVG